MNTDRLDREYAELRPCRVCTFRNADRERFDLGPPLPAGRAVVRVHWPPGWLYGTKPYLRRNGRFAAVWVCTAHKRSQSWPSSLWRELWREQDARVPVEA